LQAKSLNFLGYKDNDTQYEKHYPKNRPILRHTLIVREYWGEIQEEKIICISLGVSPLIYTCLPAGRADY
jgi:hypothetical protein